MDKYSLKMRSGTAGRGQLAQLALPRYRHRGVLLRGGRGAAGFVDSGPKNLVPSASDQSTDEWTPWTSVDLGPLTERRRDLLEAAQRRDLVVEVRHPVHRIEHHDLRAEPLPALRGLQPGVGIGRVEPQPA